MWLLSTPELPLFQCVFVRRRKKKVWCNLKLKETPNYGLHFVPWCHLLVPSSFQVFIVKTKSRFRCNSDWGGSSVSSFNYNALSATNKQYRRLRDWDFFSKLALFSCGLYLLKRPTVACRSHPRDHKSIIIQKPPDHLSIDTSREKVSDTFQDGVWNRAECKEGKKLVIIHQAISEIEKQRHTNVDFGHFKWRVSQNTVIRYLV